MFVNNNSVNTSNNKMAFIPSLTKSDIAAIAEKDPSNDKNNDNNFHNCKLVTQAPYVVSSGNGRWHVTCSVQDHKGIVHTVACSGGVRGTDFSSVCACSRSTSSFRPCEHAFTVLGALVDKEEEERRTKMEELRRMQERKRGAADDSDDASKPGVYVVMQAISDPERGYSHGDSSDPKENYNPEIMGVFFSLTSANQCAKTAIQELKESNGSNTQDDDDSDSGSDDDAEDDGSPIQWKGKEPPVDSTDGIPSVWVEHHNVQDASQKFRR